MHSKAKLGVRNRWPLIKFTAAILFISMTALFEGACTEQEQQEIQRHKVVVPIKIPPKKMPLVQERARSEQKRETSLRTEADSLKESPASLLPSVEKKEERPSLSVPVEKAEEQLPVVTKEGHYKVQMGDTLFKIAERKDVYANPLKWVSIYRLNMNKLSGMEITDDFQHRKLPEGLDLRFVTAQEAAKNLNSLGRKFWVINVLSAQTAKHIVPTAITLMKNGYHVYITIGKVRGKDWIRLRTGFFDNSLKAVAAAKEIMSIVDVEGAWAVKIEESELEEFCGY